MALYKNQDTVTLYNIGVHQIYIRLFHQFEKFNLKMFYINFPYILIHFL